MSHLSEDSCYLNLENKKDVYVRYKRADCSNRTLLILNGMTHNTNNWDNFVGHILSIMPGLGILRYDMVGMGRTLDYNSDLKDPIHIDDQVSDLIEIRRKMNIVGACSIIGLSYGGAVAMECAALHSEDYEKFIIICPYIEPIFHQDIIIRTVVAAILPFLFDLFDEEGVYDVILRSFVYTLYPLYEPHLIDFFPRKIEGVFRLAQGIRKWSAKSRISLFPKNKLHLLVAANDEYVRFDRMSIFIFKLQEYGIFNITVWENSSHNVISCSPKELADYVSKIIA